MGFRGEGRAAVIGNRHVISAIDRVAGGALHHPVGGDAGKHQVGDTLRVENCLERAGVKGAHTSFGDYDIVRVPLYVRMDFGTPGTVFEDLVLLHSRQDWGVLWRVRVIRTIGMAHMDNRHSRLAPSLGQTRDGAEYVVLLNQL